MALNNILNKNIDNNNNKTLMDYFRFSFVYLIILVILVGISAFFIIRYFDLKKDFQETEQALAQKQINERILNFTGLFIKKVLKAEGEVSFEDRLQLENSVRELEDAEILTQWNSFVESQTEEQAQKEVKDLLELLVNKIRVN